MVGPLFIAIDIVGYTIGLIFYKYFYEMMTKLKIKSFFGYQAFIKCDPFAVLNNREFLN